MAKFDQIGLKKQHGQNFLHETWVVEQAIAQAQLPKNAYVLEIGGGAGFLTGAILQQSVAQLLVFEIDPEWASYLQNKFASQINAKNLVVLQQDFLEFDLSNLSNSESWTVLANLPYHITFPILERFVQHRDRLRGGVIMVQEEVAQKLVKTSGRGYGAVSLFFQYYFDWQLLSKVPPTAFNPPPKVWSRLLHFRPKSNLPVILQSTEFWKFVRFCFKFPRRTLRNNLAQTHYGWQKLDAEILNLRAQQLKFADFLELWNCIRD